MISPLLANIMLHEVDRQWCTEGGAVGAQVRLVRQEVQLWLRRKHKCSWRHAQKWWHYRYLHVRCRLYKMVGKVSHLEAA